jgi:hypothetical protein
MTDQALGLLMAAGAETIEHPGGTLLAHLQRVSVLLASWGARPALMSAGLCHAFYGTDGFAVTLLNLDQRAVLAHAIGEEGEELVYLYASCDRKATYHSLAEPGAAFINRFTGEHTRPTVEQRRDFAELTAANELDIAAVSPPMRERYGADLLELFTRWRPLLSRRAWEHTGNILR